MKRYRKKELLEVAASLTEVNNLIMRNSCLDSSALYEQLTVCQELACALGNTLEESGEAVEPVVSILEAYCENIYQLSLVLKDANQSRKLAKKIQKQLYTIESKIKYILPDDKKEIVFLPYKASMWDSLESVWRAASQDDACDTFVVPIPYFDKNQDGSLGQMHYEGDLYPDYVPVVSWKEYDLMEHRPDIIYFHNPYDEHNYVTSVHPAYYTPELKKATDMLVYISYFIAINDKMESCFCRNPGVFLADRVIVQSEAIRKFYVKELHQCEEEYNCRGAFGNIEEKVLALGNPKYDRVASGVEADVEIPEGWRKFLLYPDGKRKKVVLYNTTIESFLKHNERMLFKIRQVLDKFRKDKDIVLLWRPHPLLLTTLESMRPALALEYKDIVRDYRRDEIGIYDDSADLYRAIGLSDAYFGDMSSVVELYGRTGKPILIQSVFYGGEAALAFEAFAKTDRDTAYASCAMFNGLFRVDLRTGDCTYIELFPGEAADGMRLHSKAVYAEGKLVFIPASAEYISVYRPEQGKMEAIPIERGNGSLAHWNPNHKFSDVAVYGKFLFLISGTYPAILRMNLETDQIDYYRDWILQREFYFGKGAVTVDSRFYIPNTLDNTVLEFDMDNCQGKLHQIGTRNHGSLSICKKGNDLWLIPKKEGSIVRWNPTENTVCEYGEYPEGFQGKDFLFTKGYVRENVVKMVPAQANMSVSISIETGEIARNEFAAVEEDYEIDFLFEMGQYYYLLKDRNKRKSKNPLTWNFYEYFRLNTSDDSLERCNFKFVSGKSKFLDDHLEYLNRVKVEQVLSREGIFFTLDDLRDELIRGKGMKASAAEKGHERDLTIGEKIHKRIVGILQ